MTPDERAAILDALVSLQRRDAALADPLTTFLPLHAHRRALTRDIVVVLGGRGAGKTALFRLVNDARTAAQLRAFFEDDRLPEATWFDAFSQGGMKHPEVGTLEAWAAEASDLSLRAFWMTHLLRRVHEEVPGLVKVPAPLSPVLSAPVADLAAWLPAAEANLGTVNATLDATEHALAAADRSVVATYDNLDCVGQHEPAIRGRYVRTLLALWLSLASRYKKLRGKVFLRDDLFDAAELAFADASKLRARAETINWDHEALYRVVVRHLAGTSEVMRAWLREVPGLALYDRGDLGWVPGAMADAVQRELVTKLAWRVIGKGVLKGETHKWIIDRLKDANRRVTPRAMLWFFGFAGEEAQKRPAGRRKTPLISDDLVTALRRTSRERVAEIKEEYPPAIRMENLRGMKIPMERGKVVARLGKPLAIEPAGIPERGEAILTELLRVGVLKAREEDGKVDVPDIYRYAYEITPDYATAWAEFLVEDKPAAREMFVRDALVLGEVLRKHAGEWWAEVANGAIARKDYDAARAECERALAAAKTADDARGEAAVLLQLGSVDLLDDAPQRALGTLTRALELAKRLGEEPLRADLLWWYGMASSDLGETVAATGAFEESARASHALEDRPREAIALVGLATVWRGAAPMKAVEYAARALILSQMAEAAGHEAWAFARLSNIARDLGLVGRAQQLLALGELAAKQSDSASRVMLDQGTAISAAEIEALRMQAAETYARDRGWGLIRETFPDAAFPAP